MRRRLAFLVSATMAMVLCAFVVPLALWIRALAADHAQDSATIEAEELSAVVATSSPAALPAAVAQLKEECRCQATVFLPHGSPLGTPESRTKAVELAALGDSVGPVAVPGGQNILINVQSPRGTFVIQTFVSNAELSRGVTEAWFVLSAFGLVLLVLGMGIADRLLTTVTRPIKQLAGVSLELASGDLDARAASDGPSEVREVAQGLNQLAERIRDLIWQERESIADLSHRLRTPLTALRLEAEAMESADSDGRLTAQVQALEHAVTTLIEDARRRSGGPGSCDAAQVLRERAAFWLVLAEDQGRVMHTDLAPGPLLVGVAAGDLAACLDALLGNVFAHTPEGARFAVRLRPRPAGGALASVEDTGPGFGAGDPVQRGASGGGSTGLGLDIARQTAEASGGSLTVRNANGGGQVIIELGPPQPAGPAAHRELTRTTPARR
jgi:signal transduction histidine kinase